MAIVGCLKMGDRCFFSMTVLKEDRDRVTNIMFGEGWAKYPWPEEEDNGDGTITLIEHEANYGYWDQRQELAKAGMVFEGYHGAGGEYGECVFACINGEHVDAAAIEATPVALVNREGQVEGGSLKAARDYYQVLEQVEEHFRKAEHVEPEVQKAGNDKGRAGGAA